ncbi:MAG: LysM peptidoglycan-binding domain-containing protein [Actinomycetota bacterium]
MESPRNKKPKKLALLSVPLAIASPALADLPATASQLEQSANPSDAPLSPVGTSSEPITSQIPTIAPKPQTYKVKSGDTVTKIAKRFGLSVSKLARLNNLGPTSLIRVGQVLRLSGAATPKKVESYKVRSGDTLSKIAAKHSLSLEQLVALNRISTSTIIYPGQVLRVAKIVPASAPVANPESYQVVAGDSLESIAKKFSLSVSELRKFNSLAKSSIIYVGQLLLLSQPADLPPTSVPAPENTNPISASPLSDEISNQDPMRPVGVCTIHGYHLVRSGESVSKIAAVYGVSTQSVLTANNLSWSSTIFVGQQLTIPGVHEILSCPSLTKLTSEMEQNAQVIYRVGKSLGVSDFGIAIALATAMQESTLRNIDYGDRDSLGLFQQRPSQGWGTSEQIMDPEYSARAFFGGPSSPLVGKIRGLLDIKNWQSMTLSQAAQAVQISAFPDAYQKWELSAWSWIDQLKSSNG